jgi:hypothetical protein
VQGGAAQLPQLLDQQRLDRIGGFERALGGAGQVEDALPAGRHLRLLPQLLDKLGVLCGEFGAAQVRFHPDFIGRNGHAWTIDAAEIFFSSPTFNHTRREAEA